MTELDPTPSKLAHHSEMKYRAFWKALPLRRRVAGFAALYPRGGGWIFKSQLETAELLWVGSDAKPSNRSTLVREMFRHDAGRTFEADGYRRFRPVPGALPKRGCYRPRRGDKFPPAAINCCRPSPFGNPFRLSPLADAETRAQCLSLFARAVRVEPAGRDSATIIELTTRPAGKLVLTDLPAPEEIVRLAVAVRRYKHLLAGAEWLTCVCDPAVPCHTGELIKWLAEVTTGVRPSELAPGV